MPEQTIYVVLRRDWEYNDNYYYSNEGYEVPVAAFTTMPAAEQWVTDHPEQNPNVKFCDADSLEWIASELGYENVDALREDCGFIIAEVMLHG